MRLIRCDIERPNLSNSHTTRVASLLSSANVLSNPGRTLFVPDILSKNINSFTQPAASSASS